MVLIKSRSYVLFIINPRNYVSKRLFVRLLTSLNHSIILDRFSTVFPSSLRKIGGNAKIFIPDAFLTQTSLFFSDKEKICFDFLGKTVSIFFFFSIFQYLCSSKQRKERRRDVCQKLLLICLPFFLMYVRIENRRGKFSRFLSLIPFRDGIFIFFLFFRGMIYWVVP